MAKGCFGRTQHNFALQEVDNAMHLHPAARQKALRRLGCWDVQWVNKLTMMSPGCHMMHMVCDGFRTFWMRDLGTRWCISRESSNCADSFIVPLCSWILMVKVAQTSKVVTSCPVGCGRSGYVSNLFGGLCSFDGTLTRRLGARQRSTKCCSPGLGFSRGVSHLFTFFKKLFNAGPLLLSVKTSQHIFQFQLLSNLSVLKACSGSCCLY